MQIAIINGPNLNLLGKREPEIYGKETFESYFVSLKMAFPDVELVHFQSNSESAIIDKIHEVGFDFDGIVINAGGYTHTSVAIADAIAAVDARVVEVHISNIYAREEFRHKSYLAPYCVGSIVGLGLKGYSYALNFLVKSS